MVEAVKVLPQEIQEIIEVRIWNVKESEGIKRKGDLGAKVPSIAIDNEVVFQSGIPQEEALVLAIKEKKGRLKFK